jgi:hypothetical protein
MTFILVISLLTIYHVVSHSVLSAESVGYTALVCYTLNLRFIFHSLRKEFSSVRSEVITAVTTKNGVFWDVTPCGSCKNRRFGGI